MKLLSAITITLAITTASHAQILSSFDALGNNPIGIAYGNDEVFVFDDFDNVIQVFDRSGNPLRTIPHPGGSTDDFDIDIVDTSMSLNGVSIPAGSMLLVDGDQNPDTVYALNPADGTVLATLTIGNDQTVGITYNPADDLIYSIDWDSDIVRAFSPADGSQVNNFPVTPAGAPALDVFYGDIDVDADGNLQIVTDVIEQTRVLTTSGDFVQDFDLTLISPTVNLDLTGIAFDNARGEAWITQRSGLVYQLAGFPVPEPASAALLTLGGLALTRRYPA
ncbi:MAG: hypothetical protein RIG82_03170 [Phycisphaeraceae bacterium]